MQGKELSEQATECQCYAGIDVSKEWLDACILPAGDTLRVANTAPGIAKLKRWLQRRRPAGLTLEATGKWHRLAQRSLHASGLPVAIVDPFRVRMFAKASGILAKTDRLDARVLAQFAAVMAPHARPPAPEAIEDLAELAAAREAAIAEQTALKNQRAAAKGAFLRAQLARRSAALAKSIGALERQCLQAIKTDHAMAARFAILISIPSIGPVVAITLIAGLRELGTCSAKQIGLLAGLAPIADDSGQRKGARVIWGGRPRVRRALYLAALSAARYNKDLSTLYMRLTGKGKPPKLALIAVARKLVVLANTLIAHGRLWTPSPPQHA